MDRSGDDFLFDMAIDDVDSETMEWLGGQEFYREWQREQIGRASCRERV